MARSEKLIKVTKLLLQRRQELRKRLGMEMQTLDTGGRESGDSADEAFHTVGGDLASQMIEYESAELTQIEIALMRLKQGRYGVCDVCEKKIPAKRLNAVPYSIMCVGCQGEAEKADANWLETHADFQWSSLQDDDREFDYRDVQVEYGR